MRDGGFFGPSSASTGKDDEEHYVHLRMGRRSWMYMKRIKAWVLVATSLEKGKMIRRGTVGSVTGMRIFMIPGACLDS